ncbi:type I restriction endonuclease subunit M [Armatimonas rosea]|uniref:Type I restriction endonuclease subunit M n=1 Tax=Armatimonas rosea TaxID=685828 RepID=A0A7W9W8Z8_ARMRO|nr:type I restriction endonuclease subunit M [Armatimonas rosea]MBB6053298.1 hypothetical protein [Armatimonas rosea]
MTAQPTQQATQSTIGNPLFLCGEVVATPGAIEALNEAHGNRWRIEAGRLIARHRSGDWGDVCREDKSANDQALRHGARILSAYHLPVRVPGTAPQKLWVITEADRSSTTILLPDEY